MQLYAVSDSGVEMHLAVSAGPLPGFSGSLHHYTIPCSDLHQNSGSVQFTPGDDVTSLPW